MRAIKPVKGDPLALALGGFVSGAVPTLLSSMDRADQFAAKRRAAAAKAALDERRLGIAEGNLELGEATLEQAKKRDAARAGRAQAGAADRQIEAVLDSLRDVPDLQTAYRQTVYSMKDPAEKIAWLTRPELRTEVAEARAAARARATQDETTKVRQHTQIRESIGNASRLAYEKAYADAVARGEIPPKTGVAPHPSRDAAREQANNEAQAKRLISAVKAQLARAAGGAGGKVAKTTLLQAIDAMIWLGDAADEEAAYKQLGVDGTKVPVPRGYGGGNSLVYDDDGEAMAPGWLGEGRQRWEPPKRKQATQWAPPMLMPQ